MEVICKHHKQCSNFDCRHKNAHDHYHMCDENCNKPGHFSAICGQTISDERKQKLKKINESDLSKS